MRVTFARVYADYDGNAEAADKTQMLHDRAATSLSNVQLSSYRFSVLQRNHLDALRVFR